MTELFSTDIKRINPWSTSLPELPYYCEIPDHVVEYHHDGDAGLDLPIWDERLTDGTLSENGSMWLKPGESVTIKTGVHLAIPEGNFGFLDSRSSTSKMKLDLLCRIIDSPFRGNLRLSIINLNPTLEVLISNKAELFQIVVMPYTKVQPKGLNSLDEFIAYAGETERGQEGFGSKERKKGANL